MQRVSVTRHMAWISVFLWGTLKCILARTTFQERCKKSRVGLQISGQVTSILFLDNVFNVLFDNSYRLESKV